MTGLRQHKQAGMTLLEVLIATAILTIISAMAFLSIDNMVKSKTTLNEHTEQLNMVNLTFYLLQSDLQFAISSQQITPIEGEFTGDSQSITLTRFKGQTATSSRIDNKNTTMTQPLQKVRWYVNNKQLMRAVTAAHGAGYGQKWQARPLLSVATFSCSYLDAAGNNSSQWPNQNRQQNQLPKKVQCLITTEDGSVNEFNITPWQQIW